MKRILTTAANGLWFLSCLPQGLAFHLSARDVEATQRRLLRALLRRNAKTEFGRKHGFDSIRSVAEFQSRVPLTRYEDYQPWIERIGEGRPRVLTADPVLLLEPTSGSTSATKLIPYTASLKAEFQRGIAPWIVDLYRHDPALMCGQAYWSVTPPVRRGERTRGGVPVGFEEDSEYLGGWQRRLAASVFAVPPQVKLIGGMESFRYVTLLFLLRSRRLALVSVWNPTFLMLLVDKLNEWWPRLAEDIARGTISPPTELDASLAAELCALNPADMRRAAEIESIFCARPTASEAHAQLWPRLRLISCWADAQAAGYANQLAELFPQARMQGKGLLATEGFVTLPLRGRAGAALSLRSHFFEFLLADESNDGAARPRLAHELKSGERYSVVMTTGGGLYRYRLHDVVEVTGHFSECPLLRFLGKADHVSDWFGEKLNALHVERTLAESLAQVGIAPVFAMLACETGGEAAAYSLFIEANGPSDEALLSLGRKLEAALRQNFHYQYCRELGQLASLRVFRIESGGLESYQKGCQSHGQRAGNIKPAALHKLDGWSRVFRGRFVEQALVCSSQATD